uniref:Protein kinase domain-containing protein n=1 Tax=Acrobeloides nanus TaxID=290746 RepID=A0A914CXR6_9BILA
MVHLPPGTRIDNFIVGQLLGKGGFGAIYEIEATTAVPQSSAWRYSCFAHWTSADSFCHFCRTHGKGRETLPQGTFNYVIMTLVEKSIQELRKMSPEQLFSINTAVGIQSLEALPDLHSIGYLHRDVKPGHITTGRTEIGELQKIYMLNFGMARKYVK